MIVLSPPEMRKQRITEQAPETIRKPSDPLCPNHVTTDVLVQPSSDTGHGIELFSLMRPCG